jgi:hypothetical protein
VSAPKCVVVVSLPLSGEDLLSRVLIELGYTAEGLGESPFVDPGLFQINTTLCGPFDKPTLANVNREFMQENVAQYIDDKLAEGKPWLMSDTRLCSTLCDFTAALDKKEVDYKVITIMHQPHLSAMTLVAKCRWKIETAADLVGRYIVGRGFSINTFLAMNPDNKQKLIYVNSEDLIDKAEEEISSLIDILKLEVTDEQRQKAIAVLKAS